MKKLLAMTLALILCLSMACGAIAETTTYPLDTETELRWWLPMTNTMFAVIESYADHMVWQKWQENTGVKISFDHPPAGMESEGFGKMLMGDDLPDIIQDFDKYYTGGVQEGYEDGLVLDLTDLVKEYAPDYYERISSSEEIWKQFTIDDKILAFHTWMEEFNVGAMMLVLRKDWLDEFGLKAEDLTTYDAIEKYFQAIIDNKPGVTPLSVTFNPSGGNNTNEVPYWGYNIYPGWYQIDGRVMYYDCDAQPHYRAFLERMHSWYDKGYLSKDFASYKATSARAEFSAGTLGCVCVNVGPAYSDADASGVPIIKGPFWRENAEDPINVYFPSGTEKKGQDTVIITTTCKDPKTAVQLLNYGYTDEGMILANYGIEGVAYNVDADGNRIFTEEVVANPTYGTALTMYIYRLHRMAKRELADTTANPNIVKRQDVVDARNLYTQVDETMNGEYFLPSGVALTADENSERSRIMTDVDTYINEMRIKFITGDLELNDASWDEYLKKLDEYGLAKAVQITQDAYDRYVAQ